MIRKAVKKIFNQGFLRRVRVVALVGHSGTGKSFRARLIMEKHNINLMVDDGLLIRDQRILAGKSAKREKNRFKAIKRAIFEDQDHAAEVIRALRQETFQSILLLGTSDKMVLRIAERLDLPRPDSTIYIEDIATTEEISAARNSRKVEGKHVIPVPVIEVRKETGHQILESISFFLKSHPLLFWKNRKLEKTIVQPEYGQRRGQLSMSEAALSQMIMHAVHEFEKSINIKKIIIEPCGQAYDVEIKCRAPFGTQLPDTLSGMQEFVTTRVERFSGIQIRTLDLTVDEISRK